MENVHALVIDDKPYEVDPYLEELTKRFQLIDVIFSYQIFDSASSAIRMLSRDNTFDIVLLDIIGIDPYTNVIPEILDLKPYLPIIMLSRQEDSDEIIRCVDLGARSFIIKSRLITGVRPLNPYDKWKDEQNWRQVLDKIKKAVDDYRPLKRMLNASLEVGTLRKKGDKESVIKDQCAFLEYLQQYKPSIADYFPAMLGSWEERDGYTYYEMPYFRMKSLRHLIFEESDKENCLEISKRVLGQVLDFCFTDLYNEDVFTNIDEKFVQDIYFDKYWDRLKKVENLLPKLKRKKVSIETYQKLVTTKHIEINGRELYNPTDILSKLKKDTALIKLLQPPFLCVIHGDLHFDNILVDDRLPRKIRIKLIDPRGFNLEGFTRGVGDVAYDIGKLLHSTHGYYDFIHAGYLTTNIPSFDFLNDKVKVPPLERQEWANIPQKEGGSGDIMTSHKKVVQSWAWAVFDELEKYIREWIEKSIYQQKDPNWWLRSRFNEAMHFCTMGIFHIKEDVGRAIAIQIRGIELINEFFECYKKGEFDC